MNRYFLEKKVELFYYIIKLIYYTSVIILPVLPNWLPIHAYARVFHMKNQALCQYKHGSVWSKDYDSAGGMKIFCIYMCNTQKNPLNSANVGRSQARVKKKEGYAFCTILIES
jgi:hypothetical protein